jgi:uncharacterized protein YciW
MGVGDPLNRVTWSDVDYVIQISQVTGHVLYPYRCVMGLRRSWLLGHWRQQNVVPIILVP